MAIYMAPLFCSSLQCSMRALEASETLRPSMRSIETFGVVASQFDVSYRASHDWRCIWNMNFHVGFNEYCFCVLDGVKASISWGKRILPNIENCATAMGAHTEKQYILSSSARFTLRNHSDRKCLPTFCQGVMISLYASLCHFDLQSQSL